MSPLRPGQLRGRPGGRQPDPAARIHQTLRRAYGLSPAHDGRSVVIGCAPCRLPSVQWQSPPGSRPSARGSGARGRPLPHLRGARLHGPRGLRRLPLPRAGRAPERLRSANDDAWKYSPTPAWTSRRAGSSRPAGPNVVARSSTAASAGTARLVARSRSGSTSASSRARRAARRQRLQRRRLRHRSTTSPGARRDPRLNGNGYPRRPGPDPHYSDGVDDDGNGFVDDIAGWDFLDERQRPVRRRRVRPRHRRGRRPGVARRTTAAASRASRRARSSCRSRRRQLRRDRQRLRAGRRLRDRPRRRPDLRGARHAVGRATSARPRSTTRTRAASRSSRAPPTRRAATTTPPPHFDHMIWVNSIVHADGTLVEEPPIANGYDLLNGCTNYGGKAWVAISSPAARRRRPAARAASRRCSSRTRRTRSTAASSRRIRAPARRSPPRRCASSCGSRRGTSTTRATSTPDRCSGCSGLLSAPAPRPRRSDRATTRRSPGWDQFTGYGRPDAAALFERHGDDDPARGRSLRQRALVRHVDPVRSQSSRYAARRARARAGQVQLALDVGCGVQPLELPRSSARARARPPSSDAGARELERRRRPRRRAASIRPRAIAGPGRSHRDAAAARERRARQPRRGPPHRRDPQRSDAALAPIALGGSGESPPRSPT